MVMDRSLQAPAGSTKLPEDKQVEEPLSLEEAPFRKASRPLLSWPRPFDFLLPGISWGRAVSWIIV